MLNLIVHYFEGLWKYIMELFTIIKASKIEKLPRYYIWKIKLKNKNYWTNKTLNLKKYIPRGHQCYDENGICPFWNIKLFQDNGYCFYLKKDDWQLNREKEHRKVNGRRVIDTFGPGWKHSFLWNYGKECGVNIKN